MARTPGILDTLQTGTLARRVTVLGGLAASAAAANALAPSGWAATSSQALAKSTKFVMRYGFRLDGQGALAGARERAARLGPTFDGYPGIVFKLYLIDAAALSLDAFIVWSTPGYATIYLGSPEFDRQVRAFGRPRVELALPTKIYQPPPELRTVTLVPGEPDVPGVSWLAAADGQSSTLAYGERPGQQFEVAYIVRGGAS